MLLCNYTVVIIVNDFEYIYPIFVARDVLYVTVKHHACIVSQIYMPFLKVHIVLGGCLWHHRPGFKGLNSQPTYDSPVVSSN